MLETVLYVAGAYLDGRSSNLHDRVIGLQQGSASLTGDMASTTSPVVILEHVGRRFGSQAALEKISACIRPGEFVAIVGRSGAGKTTLLRLLSRALVPTDGSIRMGGQDLRPLRGAALRAHRARVGVIYQQFNLVKRLRVLDNVLVGRLSHLAGWRKYAALVGAFDRPERDIALSCLDHVGLLDRTWQRTDTLSGGEQQRVAIAKILAQEPTLILGDEPVSSLDLMNGALVMETLRRIASAAGLTVISTLHHVEYARRYADRVLGLRAGRLVFDGPARDLDDGAIREIFGAVPETSAESPERTRLPEPALVAS
jgi:phosphonate transport system ATP-binding protein